MVPIRHDESISPRTLFHGKHKAIALPLRLADYFDLVLCIQLVDL